MWKKRLQLFGGILLTTIILLSLNATREVAAIVLFGGIFIWYIVMAIRSHRKRRALLTVLLDPERFIVQTEAQMEITGRRDNRSRALMTMDLAMGYMAQGKFEKSLKCLDSVNQKKLSHRNNSQLIYTINRIQCLYELGRMEEGEGLFESQVTRLAPVNNYSRQLVDLLVCERYYFLERYNDFKEAAKKLQNSKFVLDQKSDLGIQYRLAQIAEAQGNKKEARVLYEEVAREGNQLWIAIESRRSMKAH